MYVALCELAFRAEKLEKGCPIDLDTRIKNNAGSGWTIGRKPDLVETKYYELEDRKDQVL